MPTIVRWISPTRTRPLEIQLYALHNAFGSGAHIVLHSLPTHEDLNFDSKLDELLREASGEVAVIDIQNFDPRFVPTLFRCAATGREFHWLEQSGTGGNFHVVVMRTGRIVMIKQ